MPTECSRTDHDLGSSGGRRLVGAFDGGTITSNGVVVLPRGQATFHLLEAMNVAPAILDFARSNKAAHIVIGIPKDARIGPGTVSDWLQREALCPVTAVRAATS